MLSEPCGLTLKPIVDAGSGDEDVGGTGHTDKLVSKLMEDRMGLGDRLYMDNYYNSPSLTRQFHNQRTYVTGILRKGGKHNPSTVKQK